MLGEVVVFINGDRGVNYPKAKDYVPKGIPFFSASDLDGRKIDLSNAKFISEEAYEKLRNGKTNEGDILFCLRGSLGNIGLAKNIQKGAIASSLVIIRPTIEIEKDYLYYTLSGPINRKIVRELDNGSVQGNLSVTELKKVEISLPNIENQKAIAHILSTLDDKIEINKKSNETLEGIAKGLFKSWFIDFDPVKAKSEGCSTGLPDEISDLFPDSFEDSESGEIPKNWKLGNLSDVTTLTQGLAINAKTNFLITETGLPLLRIKDLISGNTEQFIDPEKAPIKTKVEKNEIIFTRTGRVGLVFREKEGVLHNNSFKVSCKESHLGNEYLFWFLKQQKVYNYVNLIASGSVQKDLRHDQFLSIEIKIPPKTLCTKFGELLLPIKRSISKNEANNVILNNLRESLLGKLLSGEIRISESEKLIAKLEI